MTVEDDFVAYAEFGPLAGFRFSIPAHQSPRDEFVGLPATFHQSEEF